MITAYGDRLVHRRPAELDELDRDALVAACDFFDERRRKRPFASDDQSDLLHA